MISRHFKSFLGALLLLLAASLPLAGQTTTPAKTELKIATRQVPPFAFQDDTGKWRGIAIELWEKIAKDLGVTYTYNPVTLPELLEGVTSGKYDLAVGALSVTAKREAEFDFTHPFFRTGLGIAVPAAQPAGWLDMWKTLFSPALLKTLGGLIALLAAVGGLMWLVERRRNDHFPKDPVNGIGSGIWWSMVTLSTVGYGDKVPSTLPGRLLAMVWMLACLIIASSITANITAALTLNGLATKVEDEAGLARVKTGTVAKSTSAERLTNHGIDFATYDDIAAALDALAAGRIDAVVYDRPLLQYRVKLNHQSKLQVLPATFEAQDYAIGLPQGSQLREPINRAMLIHGRGNEWEALVERFLGREN